MKLITATIIALAVLVMALPAAAQDADQNNGSTTDEDLGLNVQLFRPSIFGGNFISIDDSDTLGTLGFHIGALVNYTNSLLTDYDGDEPNFDYISELYTADLMLAFGTFSFLSLGVDVPIHYVRRPDVEHRADITGEEDYTWQTELGDIEAQMKLGLTNKYKHWLGIALLPYVIFPTGNVDSFLGEGRYTGGGTLVLEHDFGLFNLGLNGGYLYRGRSEIFGTEVGDAFQWGAGISRAFQNGIQFSIEYSGQQYDVEDNVRVRELPMELIATLRYQFGDNLPRLIAGAGPGLSTGIGAPVYRVLGGFDYTHRCAERGELTVRTVDEQGNAVATGLHIAGTDGYVRDADSTGEYQADLAPGHYQIGASAEGYQGAEAGAEVVSGETAQLTLVLKKITSAELCVSVVDAETAQPVASTIYVNQGSTGALTLANPTGEYCGDLPLGEHQLNVEAPGYEVEVVQVTLVANKKTTVKVELVKTSAFSFTITDFCTGEPVAAEIVVDPGAATEKKVQAANGQAVVTVAIGSHNVTVAAEGYQLYEATIDALKGKTSPVEVKLFKKIVKAQEIRFATGSSVILPESIPVLNDIARQIKKYCRVKKIIIEGHTDNVGSDEYNQRLSQSRAEAVRKYLISQGINAELLEVQAFGESRPIADNNTVEGRALNRRVEFVIVE